MYAPGEYDLAGFCVGAVEREQLAPRPVTAGDVMIGIASSGPHSNGYSLIRKIVADARLAYSAPAPFDARTSLGEALLIPTRIYVRSVLPLVRLPEVRGFAHITGGGLIENVPRIFDGAFVARFDEAALALPPVFEWLAKAGGLSAEEMRRTFNCGVGGVLVVAKGRADEVLAALSKAGEEARVVGHIAKA
jgi:phosphoribosylaminoimidazole synthetase